MTVVPTPTRKPGLLTRAATRVGRLFTATDGRDILHNTPDGWEVERPWVWWNGPDGDSDDPVWGNPPPGAGGPGRNHVPVALGKCRQLVCDALAGVPWKVFRDTELLTTPDWLFDPQGLRIDGRINGSRVLDVRHSAVEFWSAYILSLIELGEGIAYVPRRDSLGQPVPPLFLLSPADVTIDDGRYWVRDTEVGPDELIITRARTWPGTLRGMGIWDQYGQALGLSDTIGEFTGNMFQRGVPAGYLKVNSPDISQTMADKLKRHWMAAHGGSRKNIAVLNAVTDFQPLAMDPQALQLTELMKLSAWDIATMYGVPPAKLGISLGGTSLTYANIESQQIDYVQDALLPPARRIESAFDAEFPRGTEIKIILDGLRRGDTKSRYEAHRIGLDAGFLTVDEVRRMEDLPPLDPGELPADEPADEAPAATVAVVAEPEPDDAENEGTAA